MRLLAFLGLGVAACLAMTPLESRLDKQLRAWQKRLGLTDWSLSVQVVRKSALDKDAWGHAEWDSKKKTALISVLAPEDYNLTGEELHHDMECTLVHELVHIQIAPLNTKDLRKQEEVVNKMMEALVNRPCPN